MKKIAFTLAETLIVIGVLGVVAALTLPNLNNSTGDKELMARVKKTISILTDATDRTIAVYGKPSEWSASCREHIDLCWMERASEFMKISKKCGEIPASTSSSSGSGEESGGESGGEGGDDGEGGVVDGEAEASGSNDVCAPMVKGDMKAAYGSSMPSMAYTLADGLTISTASPSSDCSSGGYVCFWIMFDTDGPNKGKNQKGRDVFLMYVSDDGLVFPRYKNNVAQDIAECLILKYNCAWWITDYDNMDYLKADSSGKCPDGVALSETHTSCN